MNYDPTALKLIQELSDAPGASGFEDEVVKVARRSYQRIKGRFPA